jgi:hypothetical protein
MPVQVLLTHFVPGVAAKAADLKNGQVLPTLNGNQTLTVGLLPRRCFGASPLLPF